MDSLNDRLVKLEKELKTIKESKFHLCHCDLLATNIVLDKSKVEFIDFEYSCYTWFEYDIANHFFEWCGLN
jgi:ethanolamine kinase